MWVHLLSYTTTYVQLVMRYIRTCSVKKTVNWTAVGVNALNLSSFLSATAHRRQLMCQLQFSLMFITITSRTCQLSLCHQLPAAAAVASAADGVTSVVSLYNSLTWPVRRLHYRDARHQEMPAPITYLRRNTVTVIPAYGGISRLVKYWKRLLQHQQEQRTRQLGLVTSDAVSVL